MSILMLALEKYALKMNRVDGRNPRDDNIASNKKDNKRKYGTPKLVHRMPSSSSWP